MKERIVEILALHNVGDALQQEDLVSVMSDVTVRSDEYLPVLEFFMAPDNLTCLICSMLQEPTLTAKATAAAAREPGESPSYEEYASAFRAFWVLCGSGFSHQLLAGLSALQGEPRAVVARTLAEFDSRDNMTLEALARFLTAFMDQYSPQMLIALFDKGAQQQKTFLESLLLLVFYEPLRDILVRLCNELQGADSESEVETLVGITLLQLSPINPVREIRDRVPESLRQRVATDIETVQFARMVFTCDLITDLIHERREGSLGFAMVSSLSESEPSAKQLIAAALSDLHELPTLFTNESYTLKVLNSLLQQAQCGCVAKAAFCRATAAAQGSASRDGSGEKEDSVVATCVQGSPHEDLPVLWHLFFNHLPTLLSFLSASTSEGSTLQWRFKPTHVQLVYLMLPVLNVSCTVADTVVIRSRALDAVLELVIRFPKASILHCAIARLFIVALEDSPFMFGKELPAFRSPTDTLRLHLLLGGVLDFVLHAFGWTTLLQPDVNPLQATEISQAKKNSPPAAFLDVAISLDQALTSAFVHSPQLFMGNSAFERWKIFRLVVLLPTQTLWEEQYQPPPAVDSGPSPMLAAILFGEGDRQSTQDQSLADPERAKGLKITPPSPELSNEADCPTSGTSPAVAHISSEISTPPTTAPTIDSLDSHVLPQSGPCVRELASQSTLSSEASASAKADIPTPLSALYNEEEKNMMLKVCDDDPMFSSPPAALVIPAAMPQTT